MIRRLRLWWFRNVEVRGLDVCCPGWWGGGAIGCILGGPGPHDVDCPRGAQS